MDCGKSIELIETTPEDTIPDGLTCPAVEVMVCDDSIFITQAATPADKERNGDNGPDIIMMTRRQAFEIWSALEKGLFGG